MAWGKGTLCAGVAGCASTEERETSGLMEKRSSQRIISLAKEALSPGVIRQPKR